MCPDESPPDLSYLRDFEQVAADYAHRAKHVRPGAALVTAKAHLKWYDVHMDETPIPSGLVDGARSFLVAEMESGGLPLERELGFVVHHQCAGAYVLYVSTWRNENELWETLAHRGRGEGSRWQLLERGNTTPTFCVWVLGVVGHETRAWTRYLRSARDVAAKQAYLEDQLTGEV